MRILLIGPHFEIPMKNGNPAFVDHFPGELVNVSAEIRAVRASLADVQKIGQPVNASELSDRIVISAVTLVRNRERTRFDPRDGSKLSYNEREVAFGEGKTPLFPRIDPAVVGIIELVNQEKILLGRNARRRNYFSLIAGYVDAGENIEEAFTREVFEETGRKIFDVGYVASQPWAISGSLMLGMHGFTADEQPVAQTDGELAEVRWVTRADIIDHRIPLPQSASLARIMIHSWAHGKVASDHRD